MATLKISDISVGDWVRYKGKECTIASIYMAAEGYPHEVALTYQGICCGVAYIDHLEPIPITAEILEKNGFMRGNRGDFYHHLRLDKNRTLYIHASTNGWRVEITYDAAGILRTTHLMPDMNSVHDLQHAIRLAGLDKEINL